MKGLVSAAVLTTALAAFALAAPAFAHHSFAAEFDNDVVKTIEGEVTRVWWRNPHVRYEIAVTGEDGETTLWEVQGGATTGLVNVGWTRDTITVGDHLVIEGTGARRDLPKLWIRAVTLEDGVVMTQAGQRGREGDVTRAAYARSEPFTPPAPGDRPINITGNWSNSHNFRLTVDDLDPKPTPFTEEGRRRFEAKKFGDDPALRCVPVGLPRLFGAPRNMQIIDAGDFYLMVHEAGSQHRWVWMDGREAPEDEPLSFNGFSRGRWEGRELVIETDHLEPGWLDGSGLPMSGPETRLVEHWTFSEDGGEIARVMTITDPLYTEPLTRVRGSLRADVPVREESCDPDSFFKDLVDQDAVPDYFARERL